jgi:hypothetical protein
MDTRLIELQQELAELTRRLESTELQLETAGRKFVRSRMWARRVVLLAVCTLTGLWFLDVAPAAPPPGVGPQNGLLDRVAALEAQTAALEAQVAALEAKTAAITVAGDDFVITGKNVHIVDGTNGTESVSGLGNLTVGYNELRGLGDVRTGAHNIVVGMRNNYASFGGLVAGDSNEISGELSVVSGGEANRATDFAAVVCGGRDNIASGFHSVVSGGDGNSATEEAAVVSGGQGNSASGLFSVVSGGFSNEANANYSVVSGGANNEGSGDSSVVSGGSGNVASGAGSVVSGGLTRSATGVFDWVAGSLFEDD